MRKSFLNSTASLVLSALGRVETTTPNAPPPLRSRQKGAAFRHCYNEQRVGDKLTYFHATKGRRTRRVPA